MKKSIIGTFTACYLIMATTAFAVDRDARIIERIGFIGGNYDHGETAGWAILSEFTLAAENEKWALVAGAGIEDSRLDDGKDIESWDVALGIKHYLTKVTGVSLLGMYKEYDWGNSEIGSGKLELKQRLAPASGDICPYFIVHGMLQSIDTDVNFRGPSAASFTELVIGGGGGVDFMVNDEFAFVFEATYSESEPLSSDGDDFLDGWTVGIHMMYYWDETP